MRTAIVHLSDLHFQDGQNALRSKVPQLAAAICSTDATCADFTIVLSGDIAADGIRSQYGIAKQFLDDLSDAMAGHNSNVQIRYLSVPGNHDCCLPEPEVNLRDALIKAVQPTLQTPEPDPSILAELLGRQKSYLDFCQTLFTGPQTATAQLCLSQTVDVGSKRLQFNLYNTAILSRRKERQGELQVPMALARSLVKLDPECEVSLSVFHHPYGWLNADIGVAFRSHVEQTSDIVLTGHQHSEHAYSKQVLHGERLLYSEGDLLQDPGSPNQSGFRVVLLDLEQRRRRVVSYSWADTRYSIHDDTEWHQYSRAASQVGLPTAAPEFLTRLSDNGIGLIHRSKGPVPLESVFVYPDSTMRKLSASDTQRDIAGSGLLTYLTGRDKVIIQGSALSGKTSLAKTIVKDWLSSRSLYPILLRGVDFRRSDESFFERLIDAEAKRAYGRHSVEQYHQLPPPIKVLVIDDWDDCPMPNRDRDVILRRASASFGKVVLLVDGISYVEQLLGRLHGKEIILDFDLVILSEMSHVARGQLIDKWLSLEVPRESREFSRKVEETERLIQSVIGKNTLPSLPFIVLSLLNASQRSGDVLPENGAFGYLYEVLITAALNATHADNKPQLDKKYTLLALLAFQMFEARVDMLSARAVEALVEDYANSYKVRIDKAAILADLKFARVLDERDGNYSFAYVHYFHYFLARYFKTHLDGPQGAALRSQLKEIASALNSGTNGIFLMFVIYLTQDRELIDYFLDIASRILSEFAPSDLTSEVEFYNSRSNAGIDRDLPQHVDLDASRQERREAADAAQERRGDQADALPLFETVSGGYSGDLPFGTKLEYARSCMEILGQILRNFTGALPGERKLAILKATYLLGLRTLRAVLTVLSDASVRVNEDLAKRDLKKPEERAFVKAIEKLLTIIGQIVGAGVVREISLNVGSPDIDEDAYSETLEAVGENNATELIDLAIKLDHGEAYPYSQVRKLRKMFAANRFADRVLRDLVIANMHMFDIGREMRQRVLALWNAGPSGSALLSRSTKRLR
jgi:hypothetical protein